MSSSRKERTLWDGRGVLETNKGKQGGKAGGQNSWILN